MRRAASVWDRFYRHQKAPWRGETLAAPLLPILGAGPVLELGCGNGKTLRPLRKAGLDVVGLDVSWHVLRGLAGPRVLADARWLPFGDATFSGVLDLHCTGHLLADERAAALAEAARVVRHGGAVVVERLGVDDLRTGTGQPAGESNTMRLADGRTTHFSDDEDIAGEAQAAHLEVEEITWTKRAIRHRGKPVLRSSLRAVLRRPAHQESRAR